jgi:hypothetical protein
MDQGTFGTIEVVNFDRLLDILNLARKDSMFVTVAH